MTEVVDPSQKKRKLQDGPELEIDISAPEPPSKKALRKAKKEKKPDGEAKDTDKPKTEKTESKDAADSEAKRSQYGVWIGNLSFNTTKDDLRQFFIDNCSFTNDAITRVHMPKGAEKFGRFQNKGFAYVDFSTEKALEEAIGLSEQLLTGRRVLIKNANSFEGRPEKTAEQANAATAKPGHPPSKRIFVGNLSFDVTKESLEENFARCGTVTNVHMATFQDTGKCKGYAWVEFEEISSAEAAVRGFVMEKEEDEEEEEEESSDSSDSDEESKKPKKKSKKKSKKPYQRRIWVNQLLGRRMRMEFAEDATTRYKKRFGKDGEGRKNDQPAITEEGAERSEQQPRVRKQRRASIDESRYSKETVQRLSGAIVEAQGKKVTFD
ncbi:putative RNA binding protein Rnp24 [Penicillium brasilianum]|uniref:Putative RNA binding protein Rnp24 n=1 Tax=Penicillium brasilianum TaxID=104259 RepID=A0A1S9RYZ9_PENBI|nr:putative RNA binding protein Rnp24 [Penicillium brasilianum]